ncbi:uncharacterized protein Bfra_010178 [Botrytis fragariae]|uniref:Uncharacterized protein n=1 Tax=Botrytis fragariae TaxID=1964551 RepID=A0A8H6EF76_9HELO|nr:uncharacterized protein Bfra_010178 [Botrytis fragariae]KAF5870032.1 hypothetical protein Bfra_010178 [Botrytis fragariae]
MSAIKSTQEGTASFLQDTEQLRRKEIFLTFLGTIYLPCLIKECEDDPLPPHAVWIHRYVRGHNGSHPSTTSSCRQMLNSHSGSEVDVEFRGFLDKNCQFFLELCKKPKKFMPAPDPFKSHANFELQLVLIDRALEAQSKASVSAKVEGKMEDKVKGEVLGKLSELAGSIKSVIEVVANGGRKNIPDRFNSLE